MPRMEATDRSISPLMMISVIGSAMIAISPLDRPRLNRLSLVRKSGEAAVPNDEDDHHHDRQPRLPAHGPAQQRWQRRAAPMVRRRRLREQARFRHRGSFAAARPVSRTEMTRSRVMARAAGTRDRLVPERRDAEHVQRRVDGGEQQRAERGPDRAAAAAEDRHAADHDGGHHLQLVAGARGGVDRPVLRRPQHAGDAGDRPAHREGDEHPPADRDAGQPRRVRVRADRVQIPPGPECAQVVRPGRDHHGDHDGEVGDADSRRLGDVG